MLTATVDKIHPHNFKTLKCAVLNDPKDPHRATLTTGEELTVNEQNKTNKLAKDKNANERNRQ